MIRENDFRSPPPLGKQLSFGFKLFALLLVVLLLIVWGFSIAGASPSSALAPRTAVGLQLVASDLTSPLTLVESPDGTGRLFIVDQVGMIWVVDANGTMLSTPFLNVQDKLVELNPFYDERGLLGLAFHPDYATNGRFFVYYSAPLSPTAPPDFNHTSHISEFHVSDDPNLADPGSEQILLQVDQPQSNHNGGTVLFGPDGYMYVSLGDGGGANDVGLGHVEDWYEDNAGGNAQDVEQNLLGSILRIDVDSGSPYTIPSDNPFGDEQYAYGFRNPYRMSFDMGGRHQLFVGDAGQGLWEEVSIVELDGNYGWNIKEGTHCFDAENSSVVPPSCPDVVGPDHPDAGARLRDPVIEYANLNNPNPGRTPQFGQVVVGGHVYRGEMLSSFFHGKYIFGDWNASDNGPGGLLLMASRSSGLWQIRQLSISTSPDGNLHHYVLGFGQDLSGEVYVLVTDMVGPSGNTGKVYQLVPGGPYP